MYACFPSKLALVICQLIIQLYSPQYKATISSEACLLVPSYSWIQLTISITLLASCWHLAMIESAHLNMLLQSKTNPHSADILGWRD